MTIIEANHLCDDARLAIVAARFNEFVVDKLIEGALRCVRQHGGDSERVDIIRVPGAYEMPLALDKVAATHRYDGIIALGAVIRGATPHFDYVAGECARGISQAALKHQLPVGFGVLAVDTIEQAIERSGTKAGNKGEEAALSVIEMINLLRTIG